MPFDIRCYFNLFIENEDLSSCCYQPDNCRRVECGKGKEATKMQKANTSHCKLPGPGQLDRAKGRTVIGPPVKNCSLTVSLKVSVSDRRQLEACEIMAPF